MFMAAASLLPGSIARLAVGNSIAAKQDRAENARQVAELVCLRPESAERLATMDFRRVAEESGIEPWKLHGMADIEARRGGFAANGRSISVPELHKFSQFTFRAYDKTHPDLSIEKWIHPSKVKPGHPYRLDNEGRWDILARQAALDFDAAIRAASWGAFQIMGFNYRKLGFDAPMELVRYVYRGERAQLELAVRYLIVDGGFEPLLKNDYVSAAVVQNGPGKPKEYAAEWREASEKRRKEFYA